jgi:nucleoside-diphosphate-sugar epimerase
MFLSSSIANINTTTTTTVFTLFTSIAICAIRNSLFQKRKYKQIPPVQVLPSTIRTTNDKPITVCVTGGLGFLGSEIVSQLLNNNNSNKYTVRIFDQILPQPNKRDNRITYICGTLDRVHDLRIAFDGVDAVIHCAALLGPLGVNRDDLMRVNVRGTENVVLSCFLSGVSRLIVTSSVAAVLRRPDNNKHNLITPQRGSEDEVSYPMDESQHLEPYGYSKRLVEDIVLKAHNQGNKLKTCVLRPSIIFGARDGKLAQRLLQGLDQNIVGEGNHPIDFVHVVDVAKAHLLALEGLEQKPNEVGGKTFFVGSGRPTLVNHFFRSWGHVENFQPVPIPVVKFFSKLNTFLFAILKIAPFGIWLNDDAVNLLITPWYFDISSARRILNYDPEDPQHARQKLVQEWKSKNN